MVTAKVELVSLPGIRKPSNRSAEGGEATTRGSERSRRSRKDICKTIEPQTQCSRSAYNRREARYSTTYITPFLALGGGVSMLYGRVNRTRVTRRYVRGTTAGGAVYGSVR